MKAILQTKCRCTRKVDVGDRSLRELSRYGFLVPIYPTPVELSGHSVDADYTASARRFVYQGMDDGFLPILAEVENV